MNSVFLILCLICLLHPVAGQKSSTDELTVKGRFAQPANIQWLETFQGAWQTFHPLTIVLGFDGKEYQGIAHIGQDAFDLVGYQRDDQAMIQEIDPTGKTSGYYVVQIHEGRLNGQWWSVDFERSALISARNTDIVELRRFEPELQVLNGRLVNEEVNLIVQREETEMLSGFCFMQKSAYRIHGKCIDRTCDKMSIEMLSPQGERTMLESTMQRNSTLRFALKNESASNDAGMATVLNRYPMKLMRSTRYIGHIDCIYPVLSIPSFDTWLTTQLDRWYSSMNKHLDSLELVYQTPGPDERWRMQASAWVDITLITPATISGLVTTYNPTGKRYERTAFIFDVKSGKLLPPEEIGKKDEFISGLCADAARTKSLNDDNAQHKAWLSSAQFRHVALSDQSFILFTDFDPMHGELWVPLSYSHYVDGMKRNACVHELMNK
jgi:hypothetical protein